MGILSDSYRTYVLNDFSAVSKAVFYIFEESVSTGYLESKAQLPVQINPSKISGTVGDSKIAFVKDESGETHAALKSHTKSEEDNKFEIELIYDIYDEYNARTMNGISNVSLINDLSLADTKTTSLENLKRLAGDTRYRTLFLWGKIQIFGILSQVSFDYTAFSRWGDPLKAEAKVTIEKEHQGFKPDKLGFRKEVQPLESPRLHALKTTISAYQKSESGLVTAAAIIDALR